MNGKVLEFEHSGRYNGVFAMRDRTTGSFWSPITGRCIEGPLGGRTLATLTVYRTSWRTWSKVHPDTTTVVGLAAESKNYWNRQGVTPSHATRMLETLTVPPDKRLEPFARVLGVRVGTATRAYPLAVLQKLPAVVRDVLGGTPLVILHDPAGESAAAYDTRLQDRILDFIPRAGQPLAYEDIATRSVWTLAGQAVQGPLKGKTLRPLTFSVSNWYGWAASYPQTDIFDPAKPLPPLASSPPRPSAVASGWTPWLLAPILLVAAGLMMGQRLRRVK